MHVHVHGMCHVLVCVWEGRGGSLVNLRVVIYFLYDTYVAGWAAYTSRLSLVSAAS